MTPFCIRFNGELFLRSLFYLGRSDQSWINSGQIDADFAREFRLSPDVEHENIYPTTGSNWRALDRMIAICGERGIELRLVASPYLPAFRYQLKDYEVWVESLKKKLPTGSVFYDFSDTLRSYDYFADPLHINRRGGEAFLKQLIQANIFSESISP